MTSQRLKADQRQLEIVLAAIDLADVRDVESITTLDMAHAVGVTQGAIFRHFSTKESVWIAVVKWVGERLMSVTAAAAEGSATPLQALERMFIAHVDFVARHPAIPRLLFRQLQQPGKSRVAPIVREMIGAYRARIEALLSAGKKAGLVYPDVDETVAATLFIGMVQGLVIQFSIFRDLDTPGSMLAAGRRIFPIYLRGICVP